MGPPRLLKLVLGCGAVLACSHSPASAGPGAADGGADAGSDCPTGLQPAPDGQGCVDLSASDPCPAGTGPFLGSTTCQPVGWTSPCPTGLKADPSGWGCIDVSPPAPCSDATTIEALGQTACVPVGDCTAPFPPASANVFVDASFPASQLDATHYQGIFDAVQGAPPDAVIAVEAGTYVEDVDIYGPVTIVGRCAAQVIVVNPGDDRSGMLVNGGKGVTLSGLTLKGHYSAVLAQMGGTVTVKDSILLANRWMGIYVLGPGSQATVQNVRIAGTVPPDSGIAAGTYGWGIGVQQGGTLSVTGSAIVGNTEYGIALGGGGVTATVDGTFIAWQKESAVGMYGEGIGVAGGASLTLRQSALVANTTNAMHLQDKGSKAAVSESVLRGTLLDTAATNGGGLFVNTGGAATLASSSIAETQWDGITVAGAGSTATVTSSVVRGPLPARKGTWGYGATVASGGHLAIDGSAVVGTSLLGLNAQDASSTMTATGTLVAGTVVVPSSMYTGGGGMGILSQAGARVTLTGASVIGTTTAGVVSADPKTDLSASGTLIRGTLADLMQHYGFGALVEGSATLELSGSAVVATTAAGVALTGGTASVDTSVIRAVNTDPAGSFGDGVLCVMGAQVTLTSSYVRENPGIGLAFSASEGSVTGSWVADNTIGIQAQDGSALSVDDSGGPVGMGEVRVSSDTLFTSNASRIGSGEVPLPTVSLSPTSR
jgi:hypothetical protein